METAPLKSFATKARIDLIKEVGARVTVVLAEHSLARVEFAGAVGALEDAIARDGREQVIDRVAYTWFNRIIALRFMDANGYTPSGVVSPEAGRTTGQPEVLAEAKAGTFDGAVVPPKTQATITALLNGTRPSQDAQGEAYGLLLEAYSRSWHKAMPFMFEREGDYTELLIPTALLAADSVRDRAVKTLTEEVCREVEVIGWLYQFYISDRKAEVFDGFKKNKKAGAAEIPAATQLFTPHWIVRYLVENSLGRLWLLNSPSSRLDEQMDYYIKPVDEETDFLRITKPEELKVIDPAVGSGHMLTYAFDLLYAIYTEKGYDPAEIPGLILQHNLFGTEIDPRAGALAAFALTMKAAAKRKLFLKNPVQPNIRVLENVHFDPAELDYLWSLTKGNGFARGDADDFWNAFEHADIFGSLIQPNENLLGPLKAAIEGCRRGGDLVQGKAIEKATAVLAQASYLSKGYSVVVANPPYMDSDSFGPLLSKFAAVRYADTRANLFAMFIRRAKELARSRGLIAMVTMASWLSLKSFADLRARLIREDRIVTLIDLGAGAFDSVQGEVVNTVAFVLAIGGAGPERGAFMDARSLAGASAKDSLIRSTVVGENLPAWIRTHEFNSVPGHQILVGATEAILDRLAKWRPLGRIFEARSGISTGRNAEFIRLWYEVSVGAIRQPDGRWRLHNKGGGGETRWYGNLDYVLRYDQVARDRMALLPGFRHDGADRYLQPHVGWSKVSSRRPAFRLYPPGMTFDSGGLALFGPTEQDLGRALLYLNSPIARQLMAAVSPTLNMSPGQMTTLPAPDLHDVDGAKVLQIAEAVRRLREVEETAWGFAGLFSDTRPESVSEWVRDSATTVESAAARVSTELEQMYRDLEWDVPGEPAVLPLLDRGMTAAQRAIDLVSYAVGCTFGRYSLDKPGLVLADQGSTLQDYLAQVPSPSFMPDKDNVIPIVDGDWFEDDIVARFRQFLRAAFGDGHFEENLRFVTESLGVKDIRDYFVKSFYDDHVKRYKKRPIYWLFRSPKGSFSALIYLHRYSPSTASTVLTGYLREFIGKLEANLEHQGRVAAGLGGASARDIANAQKEADRIRKVLVELRDYEHDILFPIAGEQIALDLDDGVLVNYQKLGAALKDIGLKKGGGDE